MPNAEIILSAKRRPHGYIVEVRVWQVPTPVPPCTHPFKYSLFFGRDGVRLIGYDNERGKGDHKHVNGDEQPIVFVSVAQLLKEFREDVRKHYGVEL